MSSIKSGMSLRELSDRMGLPGRTIRFYIARGLLAGPHKAGRGASYGSEHVERLQLIQELQRQGLTLVEIGRRLAGGGGGAGAVRGQLGGPEGWSHYRVSEDVVVQVRIDAPPWRIKRIRDELARLADVLRAGTTEDET